jgi:hypothetical protein
MQQEPRASILTRLTPQLKRDVAEFARKDRRSVNDTVVIALERLVAPEVREEVATSR